VPLLPPELTEPFRTDAERVKARVLIVQRNRLLQAIEELSDKPVSEWTPTELAAFPSTTNGVTDPAYQRVRRWASLFSEELTEVHRLVNGARPLSDIELQETLYLAGRLLATVTDWPIESVDEFTTD
jgi:hypothetical protein